ncbi:MAG: hypothetical protein K8F25_16215 [Fimbriimonadaceae bacterium]|nr:hypothetical protein [Alphaproteobacteria bacterium]
METGHISSFFGRLGTPTGLICAGTRAKRIDRSQSPCRPSIRQGRIDDLLARLFHAGKSVVRLTAPFSRQATSITGYTDYGQQRLKAGILSCP